MSNFQSGYDSLQQSEWEWFMLSVAEFEVKFWGWGKSMPNALSSAEIHTLSFETSHVQEAIFPELSMAAIYITAGIGDRFKSSALGRCSSIFKYESFKHFVVSDIIFSVIPSAKC